MQQDHVKNIFFFITLGGALALLLAIFYPFLGMLSLAVTLAIVFTPLHNDLLRHLKNSPSLASLITIGFIIILVILPLSFLIYSTFDELQAFFTTYVSNNTTPQLSSISTLTGYLKDFHSRYLPWLVINFEAIKNMLATWIFSNLSTIFSSVVKLIFEAFIMVIVLFYLFKDGAMLKNRFLDIIPLARDDGEKIVARVRLTISSVVKGSLLTAILQGLAVAIGFAIFNIPQPIFWGMIASVGAVIPMVGAAIVTIPGVLYLFLLGDYSIAIGLGIWCLLLVHTIDNIVAPKFVGRGVKIHPLFIFLSVLGGLAFFGPVGFILGPVVLSFCLALLEIYASLMKHA